MGKEYQSVARAPGLLELEPLVLRLNLNALPHFTWTVKIPTRSAGGHGYAHPLQVLDQPEVTCLNSAISC